MRLYRLAVATTASLLLLVAGACSSSESTSTTTAPSGGSSSGSSGKDTGGAVKAVEVCPMVDAAAVTALGLSGPGEPSSYDGPPGTAVGICSFGSVIDDSGALVVQVETKSKDAVVDPIMTVLKNATQTVGTTAVGGSDAGIYDIAVIPGGGGVGKTVAWQGGGHVVVAARTGDNVDAAQLGAVVAGVVDKL